MGQSDLQLVFSREELLSDHDYARPHAIDGQRLHGGYDTEGNYIPPRSLGRSRAIANWTESLRRRGGDLLDADSSLLSGPRVPNPAQQSLLVRRGLDRFFWNALTITGKIEGRGRMISAMPLPKLQPLFVEDISGTALGHLHKGLMHAHGIDEGGEPEKGIGGHDVMWFVARDLAFGADAHPDAEPPERIARPEEGTRPMPQVDQPFEMLFSFLMNLLVIEFRAEIGFAATQEIMRTPDLFPSRRPQAEQAAEIIERIRTDERIHVESLRLYLGELRSLTVRTVDGATMPGSELVDPFWQGLLDWATVEQPRIVAERTHAELRTRILEAPSGQRILAEFEALADAGYSLAA